MQGHAKAIAGPIEGPRLWALILGLPLLALTSASCGIVGTTAPTHEATEVTVVATEFKLDPSVITVPAGVPVRLTFVNRGLVEHDWEAHGLQAEDVRIIAAPSNAPAHILNHAHEKAAQGIPHPMAPPGEQMVLQFTPTLAGNYSTACEVPGHKEAGMVGQLVVTERPGAIAPARIPAGVDQADHAHAAPVGAARLAQPEVAAPLAPGAPRLVHVDLETKEVVGLMDEGVAYRYWTFGGTVPGPMVRVRQGDTVELTLKNAPDSQMVHSIDLHALTGPGGGARATQVAPGQSATFRFRALNPGVYVYHCATPIVPVHVANGMYGLIVVEPPEGLPPVDREFYVVQGDFYLQGSRGEQGLRGFSIEKMQDERPDYVVFNGSVGALAADRALQARVGERVRIFFGVGGPNLTSSFHVIGEIFDRVQPEGASEAVTNVQTTLVPAGGATIVEFTVDVPGDYILVDHSLGRLMKGAAGILHVEGPQDPAIFEAVSGTASGQGAGH